MKKHLFGFMILALLITFGCKNETSTTKDGIKLKDNTASSAKKATFIATFGDQPTVAKSSDNTIGVAFGKDESIYYAESNDHGDSFGTPLLVGTLEGLMLGYSSGPQIAITADHVVITAPAKSGNLYAWSKARSTDVWNGPFRINDVEKSVEECLAAITATQDGHLFITWIDTRFVEGVYHNTHATTKPENTERKTPEDLNAMTPIGISKKELYTRIGDIPEGANLAFHDDSEGNLLWVFRDDEGEVLKAENYDAYKAFKKRNGERLKPQGKIYISSSSDGGETWSISNLVYQSPDGSVCECCKPSIETNAKGEIAIMFRNNINGSRDLHYTKSVDNGKVFSEPQKMGSGTWKLNGCPMDGGGFTAFDNGDFMTVWQREGVIYTANSNSTEQFVGAGRSPAIASHNGELKMAYTSGDDVMMVQGQNMPSEKLGTGNSPKVISTADGTLYVWVNEAGIQFEKFK